MSDDETDIFGSFGFDDDDTAAEVAKQKEEDESRGFTEADLSACIKVMDAMGKDLEAFRSPRYKLLRKALVPLLDDVRGRLFDGKTADEYQKKLYNKREAESRRNRQKAHDRNHINKTQMRNDRVSSLKKLCEENDSSEIPQVPDGRASYSINSIENGTEHPEAPKLVFGRSCYICKCRFEKLHAFYDQLCPKCAEINYKKRLATADMNGKVALVTGSRVKIGFEITLKLLRCGATVIATTRFPVNAAERYAQQPDFKDWAGRLQIVGLDLRDIARLEQFCQFVLQTYDRLDVIVNNACQTIRRPPAYYQHLLQAELAWVSRKSKQPLLAADSGAAITCESDVAPSASSAPAESESLLQQNAQFTHKTPHFRLPSADSGSAIENGDNMPTVAADSPAAIVVPSGDEDDIHEGLAAAPSAVMSQISLVPGDTLTMADAQHLFPSGKVDVNAQQLDLRTENSWLLTLGEVSTPEVVEVLAINTISPFVINSRLRPLLMRNPEVDKYVINVSAMEGKFYRYKTANHPHTNMAKAALNMMTCTAAEELSTHNIYMNSVDTGWINDENPLAKAAAIAEKSNFQTPLDEVDAAARVLDPAVSGMNGGPKMFGKFLKDYHETEW